MPDIRGKRKKKMTRQKTSKPAICIQLWVATSTLTFPLTMVDIIHCDSLWWIELTMLQFQKWKSIYFLKSILWKTLSLSKNRDNYTLNFYVLLTQLQQLSTYCYSCFIYNPACFLLEKIPDTLLTFISPTNNFSVYFFKR